MDTLNEIKKAKNKSEIRKIVRSMYLDLLYTDDTGQLRRLCEWVYEKMREGE